MLIAPVPVGKENTLFGVENVKRANQDESKEPTLFCLPFQEPLFIGFGCVGLNCISERRFLIENPTNKSVQLNLDKNSTNKGFLLSFGDEKSTSIHILEKSQTFASLEWCPSTHGNVRECLTILLNSAIKLQINAHGISGIGKV